MNMKNDFLRQLAVIVTTVFALVMNGAANAIPLNGKTTAAVSDSFNVLFVPAGYVFSIWGLIYILLLAYTVFHSLPAQRANDRLRRTGGFHGLVIDGRRFDIGIPEYYLKTLQDFARP